MPPTNLNEDRKPLVYFIDREAVSLLAKDLKMPLSDIDWKPKENKVTWMFLDHLLTTNDFRIAVEVAALRNGFELVRWIGERALKSREMNDSVEVHVPPGRTMKVTIVPDGYFFLSDWDYDYHHLLEVDMGTETVESSKFGRRDFARKIRGYVSYYKSGLYQERYDLHEAYEDEGDSEEGFPMRVLIVTTGEKRLASLRSITERVGEGREFWFTTFDKVTPDSVLTEPIWEIAGEDRLSPLIW